MDVCGIKDARKGPAVRNTPTAMVWPGDVWAFLDGHKAGSAKAMCINAAMSLAATIGSPVSLTRFLRVEEVQTLRDRASKCDGAVIGFAPRQLGAGRKKSRTTLVTASLPTVWTGGAGPMISRHFLPWWRRMRDEGQVYVFPRFASGSDTRYDGSRQPIGERALQDYMKGALGIRGSSWHWFRRGVEQALNTVHRHPDVGGPPIDTVVKNAITGRSNIPVRGSQDSYVNEIAGPIFAATRNLFRMTGSLVGGLVVPDGDPDVAPAEGDAPFETDCAECGDPLPGAVSGSMCDEPSCFWTLCKQCWPHPPSVPLRCPDHKLDDDDDDD
jgi:hypothetical protein